MKKYAVSFVFFISLGETEKDYNISFEEKTQFVRDINKKDELKSYDVYQDDENWCIECVAHIKAKSIDEVKNVMKQAFGNYSHDFWYHYIKGIDNSDYWEP